MKTTVAAATLLAASAIAAPTKRQSTGVSDTDILQYALTLEHLEATFYAQVSRRFDILREQPADISQYLAQYSQADFKAAGYPDWVRNRIQEIGQHEANHVSVLSGALGSAANAACTYTFPVTDVHSFVGLATLVENVGVSAYLGAASSITIPAYVTVAGSILTTEARHQGWLNSAVDKNSAWSGPEDTPLDFDEVYSIVAPFFTSCPSSNSALPFKAFPALTIGSDGTITTTASMDGAYVQVISGLDSNVYPVVNGKVQNLPSPQGISYAVLTSQSNNTLVGDDNILAGPMIRNYPFLSHGPDGSFTPNPAPSF